MEWIDKIRGALRKRIDNMNMNEKSFTTKYVSDLSEKMDSLEALIKTLTNTMRCADDKLLMILFDAQHDWHDLTMKLNERLIGLEKRQIELEKIIRDQKETK